MTADALHSQREHTNILVTDKDAAYVLIIKWNQPHLEYEHHHAHQPGYATA